jgi:hypothetical protein
LSYWGKSQEVCTTCRFWSGSREIDFSGLNFNLLEQNAVCQKPFGPFRGVSMNEGSSCSEWASFDED